MAADSDDDTAHSRAWVLLRCRGHGCAVPVEHAIETMRALPRTTVSGVPPWLLGISIVRGSPCPVVDLGCLLDGGRPTAPPRYLVVRAGAQRIALAVDAVTGVRHLDDSRLARLPALLQPAREHGLDGVTVVDGELLEVLESSRILPPDLFVLLDQAVAQPEPQEAAGQAP